MFLIKPEFSGYPQLDMFSCLDDTHTQHLKIREYAPKDVLIQRGTLGDMSLFLLLQGVCFSSHTISDNGYTFASQKFISGEFIGLSELVSPVPTRRVTSIVAKTPVTALEIGGREFLRWQTEYPKLYNTVVYRVLNHQFLVKDILFHCASANSLTAGAYYLVYLYQSYLEACHTPGYTGAVKIWDTRSEIGAAIVRDTRSVDRIINEFRHLGFVEVRKAKLYINAKQADKLAAYAQSHS